ncbi:hypothetical protein B1H26_07845 [Amycolatopsis sp. BJA-103]|nr:hypothetical protein B1H26_07845 [Amycolatopsis sp. BJA-103]
MQREETDFARLKWVKSSASNGGGNGECVEVLVAQDVVLVRDSKSPAVVLRFPSGAWKAFVESPLGG